MGIKDILVQFDATPAGESRIQLAIHLARRFRGYITALCVLPSPDLLVPPEDPTVTVALVSDLVTLERQAIAAGKEFKGMLQHEHLGGEWQLKKGDAQQHFVRRALAVDVVVLGQPDPDDAAPLLAPEDVILACGRPVLVVPHVGHFDHVGENVVVAWNGSRESARAAHDALPLLTMSNMVAILSVNPDHEVKHLGGDLVRHLHRYGLNAKTETTVAEERSTADAVLSHAADSGSDLIVMGAQGHSRLRELILGGMTRDILRSMTVPVLMSH
jgi:nucleotide-binding universal stress UspA family protein